MIAHVAEAGEGRGRVVLQLGPTDRVSEAAVSAALFIARAFQSEMEALFLEDSQLYDIAGLPFAREISLSGRRVRPLSATDIAREMRHVSSAVGRKVTALAQEAEVACRCRVIRDEIVHGLAAACAEHGPWNLVTLAGPLMGTEAPLIARLFEEVHGTTGFVITGPKTQRCDGPVVALIEDAEHVPPMLRTAERLATPGRQSIHLLLAAGDAGTLEWLEGQTRLILGDDTGPEIHTAMLHERDIDAAADKIRTLTAGFTIARWGGRLAPREGDLTALVDLLEGPLLLVR